MTFLIGLGALAGCTFSESTLTIPANDKGRHVLYITDDSLPPGAVAPRIRSFFAPTEVQGWNFINDLTPSARIDTIIVDGTIPTENINAEWLTWAYDHAIQIIVLDRYTVELANLINDPSIMEDNWVTGDDPYPGHFYVAVNRHIDPRCSSATATRIVENIERGADEPITGIMGPCGGGGGKATYSLEESLGFEALRNIVNHYSPP